MKFISKLAKDKADKSPATALHYEAGLAKETRDLLPKFAVKTWREAHLGYLERRISRNPRDLLAHTQRILLNRQSRDIQGTWGAMLDLFLALGNAGYDLRKTLLEKSVKLLDQEQKRFLRKHLKRGLFPGDRIPEASMSCLSNGVTGITHFIERNDLANLKNAMPAENARFLQTSESWKLAQHLLEDRLRIDPGDSEACEELLALYRKKDLREEFRRSYARLSSRQLALPESWKKLDREFFPDNNTEKV